MNRDHRYILEKNSIKHHCPNCNKKTYVRYIDTVTGNYLPEQYGRCDRESKCSYHLNPYLEGYAKMMLEQEQIITGVTKVTAPKQKHFGSKTKPQPQPEPIFFDFKIFKQTLQPERYENNNFIQNLLYRVQFPFDVDEITKIIQLYRLGTIANGYRAGAITFPFIDINSHIRAVQIKQFDEQNHTIGTDFLHSVIEKYCIQLNKSLPDWLEAYKNQDKFITCLFGEHLLSKYPNNPVALVEAPKTAVYGTLYFGLPETPTSLIWLAVYNKSSFSFDKLKVLKGRFVYVFPDLSEDGKTFNEWETKAKEYESRLPGTRFIFSDLLERLAPVSDKSEGYDLADYLVKQDWRLFRKCNIIDQTIRVETVKGEASEQSVAPKTNIFLHNKSLSIAEESTTMEIERQTKEQKNDWSNEITELESFFANFHLPTHSVKLNKCSTITNCSFFVETHLAIIKANKGVNTYLSYLKRLQELKDIVKNLSF